MARKGNVVVNGETHACELRIGAIACNSGQASSPWVSYFEILFNEEEGGT